MGVSVLFFSEVPASLTECRSHSYRTAAPPYIRFPGSFPSAYTIHVHVCTPLEWNIALLIGNEGHIDLQVIYTIPGCCTLLYIPQRRNLSTCIKRHGSVCGSDCVSLFVFVSSLIWPMLHFSVPILHHNQAQTCRVPVFLSRVRLAPPFFNLFSFLNNEVSLDHLMSYYRTKSITTISLISQ